MLAEESTCNITPSPSLYLCILSRITRILIFTFEVILAPKMEGIQRQLDSGAVPNHISNVCPRGTKFHVLEVGWLECGEAYEVRGANASAESTKDRSFVNKRRELPIFCILIDHPHEGLILWETGCGKDYPEVWGPVMSDFFPRKRYEPRHELKNAVETTGNKLEDIKKILIGHLHIDHAGGLDMFMDRKDVEIWVHDRELKSAFWSGFLIDQMSWQICQTYQTKPNQM